MYICVLMSLYVQLIYENTFLYKYYIKFHKNKLSKYKNIKYSNNIINTIIAITSF